MTVPSRTAPLVLAAVLVLASACGSDEAGPVLIGCHEPHHYESGMVIDVDVT